MVQAQTILVRKNPDFQQEETSDSVISEEPQAVEQAKSNPQTINYLVGKVMQKTKGIMPIYSDVSAV